jgi:hypothetical protein
MTEAMHTEKAILVRCRHAITITITSTSKRHLRPWSPVRQSQE